MNLNLKQRIITGLLGGSLVITMIYLHPFGLWMICLLLMLISFYEWLRLEDSRPLRITTNLVVFIALVLLSAALAAIQIWKLPLAQFGYWSFALLPFIALLSLAEKDTFQAARRFSLQVAGIGYIAVPWTCYFILAWNINGYEWRIPLGLQFLHWTADTAAYFVGKKWGKNKLLERISPGKTWEGFAGGLGGVFLLGILLQKVWPVPCWNWVYVSLIISIVGVGGDLFESLMKRSYTLKDSGSILPGHGGVLDRFDGFLLTLPVIYIYAQINLIF
jgi:phosphatidate cytidylyltransferase